MKPETKRRKEIVVTWLGRFGEVTIFVLKKSDVNRPFVFREERSRAGQQAFYAEIPTG